MPDRFVIWSFEHDAWWRPGGYGYTPELAEAGRYTWADAQFIVRQANIITMNEAAIPLARALDFSAPPSIVCPRCRRRSFNANDIRERYCGACHDWF